MTGHYRRATMEDVKEFLPHIREADVQECQALLGVHPEAVLPMLIITEPGGWAIVSPSGEVVGLAGVAPVTDNPLLGSIWMVASPRLQKHKIEFLRKCKSFIAMMHEQYPLLYAYTDVRNTQHHQWLRWCGFQFISKKPSWGVEGKPFYEVIKVKKDVSPDTAIRSGRTRSDSTVPGTAAGLQSPAGSVRGER